ncbi:MAG: phosphonate C-P lyase system protein PhnG [Solirubrobacterales bacterium]|nr:phosphonate C-P lyase system protein PhnG [Solirubrobacterales bacterium]
MSLSTAELHELIAHGRLASLEAAVREAVGDAEVLVRTPAETALTMVRVRDTVEGTVFNVGEALVTRCEVELEEQIGWSTVVGDQRRRALCGALLDAAHRRTDALAEVEAQLLSELQWCREQRRERWAAVQDTRVDFEEMAP